MFKLFDELVAIASVIAASIMMMYAANAMSFEMRLNRIAEYHKSTLYIENAESKK